VSISIVRAKLSLPELPPDALLRPRLVERLNASLQRRLTLISAPAGYGKTTLLANWLAEKKKDEGRGMKPDNAAPADPSSFILHPSSFAWLTLDDHDNDPLRFLTYLVAALPLAPARRARAEATLIALPAPATQVLIADLMNDLAELDSETILVLDDYHTITSPTIHDLVGQLISQLPPRAHLLVATRSDPPFSLARMRARGQLAELRAADLCFSPEETAAFLLETMNLPLARRQVATLAERTEGWPAGLQLIAIALRDRSDRASFDDLFTGNHRYIVDYLIEDVFIRQPPHMQMFLLQTSILDRLSGPLCDAILGLNVDQAPPEGDLPWRQRTPTERSYSHLILEELDHQNLFLVPLDAERNWYRYHHLFAEVLRERMLSGTPADQVAILHRRASAWCAVHGLIPAAVNHALAAGAVDDVVSILEPIGLAMATRVGEATLRSWLPAIPEQVIRTHPRLALLQAWLALADYQGETAHAWLAVAEEVLSRVAAGNIQMIGNVANLRGEICAVRARLATIHGDADEMLTSAGQALELLQYDNLALRTRVAKDLGYAYMARGAVDRAVQAFAEAMINGFSAGYPYISFMAVSDYAYVQYARGAAHDAVQACRQVIAQAVARDDLSAPGAGLPFLALADISRERYEFAGMLPALAEANAHISPNNTTSFLCLMIVEARVACVQGEVDTALASIRRARFIAQQRHLIWAGAVIDAIEAQIQIASGNLGAATSLIERARVSPAPAEFRFFPPAVVYAAEHCAVAPLQLRLARGLSDEPATLRDLTADLEDLICAADHTGMLWSQIKLRALQALAFAGLDQESHALMVLGRALALAAPESYLYVLTSEGAPLADLLDRGLATGVWPVETDADLGAYLQRLLDLLVSAERADAELVLTRAVAAPRHPSDALPEPLSTRELDVLRLMAEGQTNTDIAETLVIAVSTVKSHVNSIFGKLGVSTRAQAIARARRLDLA
jgi:LuxR family transcriptional regulator, maltose regulon positive regulatory protein